MMNWEAGFAVYVEPPKVSTAGEFVGPVEPRFWVDDPMTAIPPPVGSDIGVPETVTCDPGLRV